MERQIRILLGNRLSSNDKMLGQIIHKIRYEGIKPYNNYLAELVKINNLRKKSAHTGLLTKSDVENMRTVLFIDQLLNALC